MPTRLLIAVLLTVPGAGAEPRTDAHGDALPDGAIARFGTVRFRTGASPERSHLSADGSTLATETEAGVCVWDVETGRLKSRFRGRNGSYRENLRVSPDGRLVAREADGEIAIHDSATGARLRTLRPGWAAPTESIFPSNPHLTITASISFFPGTGRLAVTAGDEVSVFDPATGMELSRFTAKERVGDLTPSGRFFLHQSAWATPCLIDAKTGEVRCRFPFKDRERYVVRAVSLDDRVLCETDYSRRLRIFAADTGKLLEDLDPPWDDPRPGPTAFVSISPDSSVAYLSATGRATLRRELKNGKWLPPLPNMPGSRLFPHPDGRRLLQLDDAGVLRRYDLKTLREIPLPDGFEEWVKTWPSPDGRRIAAYDDSPTGGARLRVLDSTGRQVWSLRPSAYRRFAWSPDGKRLAAAGDDRVVLLDAATGKPGPELRTPAGTVPLDARFAPDGKQLFVQVQDVGIALFDLATNKQVGLFAGLDRRGLDVAPDGRLLLSHDRLGLSLFDPTAGRFAVDWCDPKWVPNNVTLPRALCSPDGSYVLSWEFRETACVRDPNTLAVKRRFRLRGADGPFDAAVSPNGLWLAVGSGDGRLRLWDVASGERIGEWSGHLAGIDGVSFAGVDRAVTSSKDLTALLWELRPKEQPVLPLWYALAGPWAADAYRAVWAVAADPTGPDLCRKYVCPVSPIPAEKLNQWVADLGADRFAVREAATRRLEAAGRVAERALRAERARTTSEEVRTRIDRVLATIPSERTPAELLHARAVAAMELAGTAEAKKLLTEWAAGAPGARLTTDAQAALSRLAVR